MGRAGALALTGLAVLAAVALAVSPGPLGPSRADGAFPGKPGKIAFTAERGSMPHGFGTPVVKAVKAKGGRGRFLAFGSGPEYSPDGRRILYTVSDGIQSDVMIMRSDGSHRHRALKSRDSEYEATFGPSGKRIYFSRYRRNGGGYGDIYSASIGGGQVKRLTRTGPRVDAGHPAVAANGRFIVYQKSGHLYTMRPDGSRQKRLTRGVNPDISPNSRWIAYTRNGKLCLIGAGGKRSRVVLRDESGHGINRNWATQPAFSPGGGRIAFVERRMRSAGPSVHVSTKLMSISVHGKKLRRITKTGVGGTSPDWQPLPRSR